VSRLKVIVGKGYAAKKAILLYRLGQILVLTTIVKSSPPLLQACIVGSLLDCRPTSGSNIRQMNF
jgi:hypothetical protein